MISAALSNEELRALLEASRAHSHRNYLAILVGFWHGLRASEIVSLRAGDISGDGFLTVRRLKGSNRTRQQLIEHSDDLLDERKGLFEYVHGMQPNQRLFPISRERFWQLFQRYGEAANLPKHKRHPHALKHTIAMQTIHGAGIENVRIWLGHKSISSTGEYLKRTEEQAAQAIRGTLGV